jgi:GAF domain-containing protein
MPVVRASSPTAGKAEMLEPSKFRFDRVQAEQVFDSIVNGAAELPLNTLIEGNLKTYFHVDSVCFFHEIETVSVLYCPTNTVFCPHGSGLIGYSYFAKKVLNVSCASAHVAYSQQYDGRICQVNSRLLVVPFLDEQSSVRGVVHLLRSAAGPTFGSEEEAAAAYLQSKFQCYARWLFQPAMCEQFFPDLIGAGRIGSFISSMTSKLTKIFNCRVAEIWDWNPEDSELHQFMPDAVSPLPVPLADAGIVGFSLSKITPVAVMNCSVHPNYNSRSDGAGDQSLLVIPIRDSESGIVHGIALRAKRMPQFFTDLDEKLLVRLSPAVIASLNASQGVERSYRGLEEAMKTQNRLRSLLDVAEGLSGQLNLGELVPSIMQRACELVKADRCSLFMVSETREKLVTSFHGGLDSAIEIPIAAGIVGFTATTGEVLNIKDAYADPRFNRSTDMATGYHTRSLLCVPIFDNKSQITGVTEMINKIDGVFTAEDEKLVQIFNVFVGISLQNARLYRASIDLQLQLRSLLQIGQTIAGAATIKRMIEDILKNARRVIGAGRAMIFTLNLQDGSIDTYAVDEDGEAKARRAAQESEDESKGRIGARRALIQKMMGVAEDADAHQNEDDERWAYVRKTLDTGESQIVPSDDHTDTMILAPIVKGHSITGALLMQWKKNEPAFSMEDLRLLESFAVFIAIAVEKGQMKANESLSAMELKFRQVIRDPVDQTADKTPQRLRLSDSESLQFLQLGLRIDDFDSFRYGFYFFDCLGLRTEYSISNRKLFSLLFAISESYFDTEYFNWQHAKRCAHFLCCALSQIGFGRFRAEEKLALLLAVLAHDLGHYGFRAEYRRTVEPLVSYLYGLGSSMKSQQCSIFINLISRVQCDIFADLSIDRDSVLKRVIDLISMTDMRKWPEVLTLRGDPSYRLKLLTILCHIGDLARPEATAKNACQFLTTEYFETGELKNVEGIVYTDEEKLVPDREKSQFAILWSVFLPVYQTAVAEFPELSKCLQNVQGNIAKLK